MLHNSGMPYRPPAKFEFDLLQFLSGHEGLTVRQIFEEFGQAQGYVRGTIVKSMDRLLKKGLVEREIVEGYFVYRAKDQREDLERKLVESFVMDRLGGRLAPLASFLTSTEALDPDEVKKLREHLNQIRK